MGSDGWFVQERGMTRRRLGRVRATVRASPLSFKMVLVTAVLIAAMVASALPGRVGSFVLLLALCYGPVAIWRKQRSVFASLGVAAWGLAAILFVAALTPPVTFAIAPLLLLPFAVVAAAHARLLARNFVPCRTVAWTLLWAVPATMFTWRLASSGPPVFNYMVGWMITVMVLGWRIARAGQDIRFYSRQQARASLVTGLYGEQAAHPAPPASAGRDSQPPGTDFAFTGPPGTGKALAKPISSAQPVPVAPLARNGGQINGDAARRVRGGGYRTRRLDARLLPAREKGHAALAPGYDIPQATYRARPWLMVIPMMLIGGAGWALHGASSSYLWLVPLGFVLGQVCLSWSQRAVTVTRRQAEELTGLYVTAIIPCYNEDPAILDRTIYALMMQTQQPDRVVVVDDGSVVAYDEVRNWWTAHSPAEFSWIRQGNAGKKHAQYTGFTASPEADIFVTVDSDSALAANALEEGLKPFADPKVMSVAGLEAAYNLNKNVLTRMQAMRTMVFQLFAMSAQSVAGGATLINPGAFSLYRGHLIRQVAEAYVGETFFGIPVRIGDDTMLTLFALCAGKAVHQPTAAAFNVYPETLSHHLRQWIRWMRASTIRTMWRLRYLPLGNYSWWFSVYQLWAYITSIAVTAYIAAEWPLSAHLVEAAALTLALWPLAVSVRLVTISRSDMTWLDWVKGLLLLPVGALWYMLALRQLRIYGAFTCYQQGWGTREKIEVLG